MAWAEPRRPAWLAPLWRPGVIALLAASVMVPHYMLPATHANVALHEVHRHLLYAPILLAALWYNWRGGLLVSLLVGMMYFPHLLTPETAAVDHAAHAAGAAAAAGAHSAPHPAAHFGSPLSYLLAMISYLAVGGGVGILFGRLRRTNAELARAMAQLTSQTRELLAAEEQLRRSDRLAALGQLTSGLAHEIRNPLASIRGAAEILGDPHLPEPRRREFSQVMIEETERLDHVLGEFLDYARHRQREQQSAQASPAAATDVAAVTAKCQKLLAPQLARHRAQLVLALPDGLPRLALDAGQLQQILLNLLLNALQAIPAGGQITLSGDVAPDPPTLRLRVADNGPGVPEAERANLFSPFHTTKPGGTGLGLVIAQRLISSHGGTLTHEPNLPRGACFVIALPLGG